MSDEPDTPADEPELENAGPNAPEHAPEHAPESETPGPEPKDEITPAGPPPSASATPPERPLHIDTSKNARQRLDELAPMLPPGASQKRFSLGRLFWGMVKLGLVVGVVIPLIAVAAYRFIPPPGTILMVQGVMKGRGVDYRWVPLKKISPNLVSAAIASEDSKFCEHHGFDIEAIQKAMNNNARGRRVRGGSTISQQTAKNVFLWPQRDWVRKGLETYFTVLIETIWGKRRIMEVYLNVAEMGPGIYGAEAASRRYFKKSAAKLTTAQAARLISVLPSPNRYKVKNPGPYVARRSRRVGAAAGTVRREGMAGCVLE